MNENNESEIIKCLEQFNSKNNLNKEVIVYNGHDQNGHLLSIENQMKLFINAFMVIGPHGSAICNSLWCQNNTPVVEFVSGIKSGQVHKSYPFTHTGHYLSYYEFFKTPKWLDYYHIPFNENSTTEITEIDLSDINKFLDNYKINIGN